MLATKVDILVSLARQLVAAQFPQWAGLTIRPVEFDGWDNRTFHLVGEMAVRLPSAVGYTGQVKKEHRRWPRLALLLPLWRWEFPMRATPGIGPSIGGSKAKARHVIDEVIDEHKVAMLSDEASGHLQARC